MQNEVFDVHAVNEKKSIKFLIKHSAEHCSSNDHSIHLGNTKILAFNVLQIIVIYSDRFFFSF